MIDITTEDLIPFRELPDHLPKQPSGKKLHLSACYRWKKQGVQGVRLETVFIAGCSYSSKQALNRFWQRVTEARDGNPADGEPKCSSGASDQELQKAGW